MWRLAVFVLIISNTHMISQKSVKGYVRQKDTNESMVGAIVFNAAKEYCITDQNGYFELFLSKNDSIFASTLGMKPLKTEINDGTTFLNLYLEPIISEEIIITAKNNTIKDIKHITVNKEKITKLSSLAGEIDVMQALQFNPGVQHANEGQSNIVVRGGLPDQNLVLINGVRLYNYLHLFGFIPFINGEMIKDVKFYKDNFPAKYGGRASSTIDITMFDGNTKKTELESTIGLISSKITYKKPLLNGKMGINIGGRVSNLNLIKIFSENNYKNSADAISSGINIYDVSFSSKHIISDAANISLFGIISNDNFDVKQKINQRGEEKNKISWKNALIGAKFHSIFNNILSIESGISLLNYSNSYKNLNLDTQKNRLSEYIVGSGIHECNIYTNFKVYFSNKININSGIGYYMTNYNVFNYKDISNSLNIPLITQKNTFGFVEGNTSFESFDFSGSLRLDLLDKAATLQPRINVVKKFNTLNVSVSYSVINQSAFLIQPMTLFSPIEIWVPSTKKNPNISSQFSVGVRKEIGKHLIVGVNYFIKTQTNIADISTVYTKIDSSLQSYFYDISYSGKLKAKGVEQYIRFSGEKFNFDVNYTYNHSTSAFSDINNNTPYNTNFFRPHSFNMAIGWRPFKKITFNLKSIFSSGHPISIPVNAYIYDNVVGLIFNEKNNGRYPDYFRMDVSIEFLKSKKSIWNFSVYNLTNKRNPFAITFEDKVQYTTYEDVVNFKIIPSISYTYKFYGYN